MADFNVDFTLNTQPEVTADLVLSEQNTIDADLSIEFANSDHNALTNRDLPDQHPISAITGLQDALDEVGAAIKAETDARIAADADLQEQIDNIDTDKTFEFEQGIASDVWVIIHNLNKYPSITLVDSSGMVFQAQAEYNNLNQVTIYLNGATTGKAYLN